MGVCFSSSSLVWLRYDQILLTDKESRTKIPKERNPLNGDGLSTTAKVGIAIGVALPLLAIIIFMSLFCIRRYRDRAEQPMSKETSVSMQEIASNPAGSPSQLPDVLDRSIVNNGFYEDIDAMDPSKPHPATQDQWPPSYNELQHFAPPPGYPGRTGSDPPPPPVPNTTRPSQFDPARPRSRTDVNPTPAVPKTRRPSDFTAPRGLTQPESSVPFNVAGTTMSPLPSQSEVNTQQPMGLPNQTRQWDRSRTDICFRRRPTDDSPPPPLLPRTRRTSAGNPPQMASDVPQPPGVAPNGKPLYSNVQPISEAGEAPSSSTNDNENDDDNADGYITCVR